MPENEVIDEVVLVDNDEPKTDAVPAEEVEGEPKTEKPNKVQSRIDELTRERHEARREAEFWREAANAKPKEAEPEKPKRADFADDEAYLDARDAYVEHRATVRAKAELAQEQAQHTQEQAARTVEQTYAERAKGFKAATADFDDVMRGADDIRVSNAARDAILESEMGPQVAYYLAKHPEEAHKVSALSPLAQVRELGRIEERLSTTKQQPITSKAPNPITPTRGAGGKFTKSESDMTGDEFEAHYKQTYRK